MKHSDQIKSARAIIREAAVIEPELKRELTLAGAWRDDAHEVLLDDFGDRIACGKDGRVSGVSEAVAEYKAARPDEFITFLPDDARVINGPAPFNVRFMRAVQARNKWMDRNRATVRAQKRAMGD